MQMNRKILFIGESWFTYSVHQKGFDTFTTCEYVEGAGVLLGLLRGAGWEVEYVPSHEVAQRIPADAGYFAHFGAIVLSDVGSNTFLLTPDTFSKSLVVPDRLALIRDYVRAGGGLLMIGGYMSFAGIDGKARYGRTALAGVLPVAVGDSDDRVECPGGVTATVVDPSHPAVSDIPTGWPALLGYNQVVARAGATTLAEVDGDPLISVGTYGEGRSAVFTSDVAPHWAPSAFMDWPGYPRLWLGLLGWLAQ